MAARQICMTLAVAATAKAISLSDICSNSKVNGSLPSLQGIEFTGVTSINTVLNASVESGINYPGATGRDYCNVTITYHHAGKDDDINVWYYLPSPAQYKDRFLATGGGGFAINSGASLLQSGLVYDAASGCTDGGLGSFGNGLTDAPLKGNGSINYDAVYNFGYLSIHEMTVIGQGLVTNIYGTSSKLYSYYQGCSEGGRDGWSQVQRYGSQFDGASIGAPAFRQAFQQPQHNWPQIFESMNGYVPTTCERQKIVNDTIAACNELDGLSDGVVSRSDLCRLHHNASSSIGGKYSCAESSSMNPITGASGSTSPAANGTVTAGAVAVYNAIIEGPVHSHGRRIYTGYQPVADVSSNGSGTYENATGKYEAVATGIGNKWINHLLNEVSTSTLSMDGITGHFALGFSRAYRSTVIAWKRHGRIWKTLGALENVLGSVIEWVEKGIEPTTLNATFLFGDREGQTEGLCSFPSRPMWKGNDSMEPPQCVMPDDEALKTWFPKLNSIPLDVYDDA
ncbi:hypothetical protein D0868_10798 [Hortaea werneckii]|uniref:Carboxylic ester hydrolase n=1 Tax=Hortaea werneckii TaxID=91943 RepID=A0A3M7BKH2_HORWE|nr:hypothetical protein D0868_10798 [Hortaea werneckii]RMY40309.1 hypothetical protein D0866_01349 [Hortaea werneckii]